MIGRNRLLGFGGPGAPLVCGALYLGLIRRRSNERGSHTALLVEHAMAPLARGFHFSIAENPVRVVFTEREQGIVVSDGRIVSIIPAFSIGVGGKR
jgi:hypothetical protein